MRLDKYLAQSNIGTRKKVHEILRMQQVEVNGEIVCDAIFDINPKLDEVKCSGQRVIYEGSVTYMFNKPKGCITARSDENEKTVLSYFTDVNTEGLFMVGRLDKDTEGLLLLTNDGEPDYKLMNPNCHTKKTYFFWATGNLSLEEVELLETGVNIERRKTMLNK